MPDQRKEARAKDRNEKRCTHTKVEKKEAWKSQEILNGTYSVPDLKVTVDDIGKMDTVCPHCGAFKFKKETASTCCSNGKVGLDRLPQPPDNINKLWQEDTAEG